MMHGHCGVESAVVGAERRTYPVAPPPRLPATGLPLLLPLSFLSTLSHPPITAFFFRLAAILQSIRQPPSRVRDRFGFAYRIYYFLQVFGLIFILILSVLFVVFI